MSSFRVVCPSNRAAQGHPWSLALTFFQMRNDMFPGAFLFVSQMTHLYLLIRSQSSFTKVQIQDYIMAANVYFNIISKGKWTENKSCVARRQPLPSSFLPVIKKYYLLNLFCKPLPRVSNSAFFFIKKIWVRVSCDTSSYLESKEQMLLFVRCLSLRRVERRASVITSCVSTAELSGMKTMATWAGVCWTVTRILKRPTESVQREHPLPPLCCSDCCASDRGSWRDNGADMREKERGDNSSHLRERTAIT